MHFRLHWRDALTAVGLLLALAGMRATDTLMVVLYFGAAAVVVCVSVWGHTELSKPARLVICCAAFAAALGIALHVRSENIEEELAKKEGVLIPDGLPPPLSRCPTPPDAMALYLGNGGSWAKFFPHTVVSSDGEDLLWLEQGTSNSIEVSARIFDERGELIARLERNQFTPTAAASRIKRPDRSTLEIYDHKDRQVLRIHFDNYRAMEITAILHSSSGRKSLVIAKDGIFINGTVINQLCTGNSRYDVTF